MMGLYGWVMDGLKNVIGHEGEACKVAIRDNKF